MKSEKEWDVISVGDVFMDVVLSGLPAWPEPGQEVYARLMRREAGGAATITACGLAKLGMKVGLFAVAGSEDGQWLVERVNACGVDTRSLRYHPSEATGLTVSVSTPSDRSFFTYFGANQTLPGLLGEAKVVGELARARHVHLTCAPEPSLVLDLVRALHAEGCRVSLDVGWKESWLKDARSWQALSEVDLFFPNEHEARLMTGSDRPEDMLRLLAEAGLRNVALKLGARGAVLLWDGEVFRSQPHPVEPLDTTGAGDCFDAGFIYGWLHGEPPEDCLRIANICGALSTQSLGGIASFPTPDQLKSARR